MWLLGLYGVLWYNIEQRRSELGLRRVMGAEATRIQTQVIYETLIVTGLGILLGYLFVVQLPFLDIYDISISIYFKALLTSTLFITVIAIICSAYPSMIAAKVAPAMALRED